MYYALLEITILFPHVQILHFNPKQKCIDIHTPLSNERNYVIKVLINFVW